MRQLLTFFYSLICLPLFSQVNGPDKDLTGLYRVNFAPTEQIKITTENNKLMLELVGQGKAPLSWLANDQYEIKVKPKIGIQFIRDSAGRVNKFLYVVKTSWTFC
ncbi:MAG: hypothetical protein ACHQET_13090 [Chitinophagales bacterium]